MTVTFQRARSEEQRQVRRRAILDTAAAMLVEMPVAQLRLNELSRRAGLAKSNVLRYFESREAVLLELLDIEFREWLATLPDELADGVDATADVPARREQLAQVIARSLATRPVLCDLVSAQAAVLERNVSSAVAARFKRAAVASVSVLAGAVLAHLSELGEPGAERFAALAMLVAGAVWTNAQPSAAMLAAYEADPALAAMRMDVTETVREILATVLAGLLVRPPGDLLGLCADVQRPDQSQA